jgi:hypothetical protein
VKAIFKLGNILIPAINIHLGKDRQQFNLYFSETLAQPIGGSRGQHGAIISLRLGFRRNFVCIELRNPNLVRYRQKFLRNPNLNEITRRYRLVKACFKQNISNFVLVFFLFTLFSNFHFELHLGILSFDFS